jgi:protease-4
MDQYDKPQNKNDFPVNDEQETITQVDSYPIFEDSTIPYETVDNTNANSPDVIEHEPLKSTEPVQKEPHKKRSLSGRIVLYLLIFLGILVIIVGGIYAIIASFETFPIDSNEVSVIYVQGTLITGNIPSGFGFATSEDISRNIQNAADDNNVKAIVLRINSAGGTPAAAQEILIEINKAREKKPVVVSMGDVAASAAYYISVPAERIIANPDTITGSIGVIWVFENRSAFYEEEGVEFYVAKSGELKDMGADWRGLTTEEKNYSEEIILDAFQRFVDTVAQNRNMSRSEVEDLADGRVYTGSKAVELGLVDETGNLYDALDIAAKLGGIEGDYTVTYENKLTLSSLLFGGAEKTGDQAKMLLRYLYESPFGIILA